MKRSWKTELKGVYEAPEPLRKQVFLENLPRQELSVWDFIKGQARYLQKGNWVLAALFFVVVLIGANSRFLELAGIFSACVPWLAMSLAAESSRSIRYEMEELELSSRFSLKTVVTVRLGILGLGNLVILGMLFPVLWWQENLHLLYLSVYLLVPYLLACFLNLMIVRRIRGRECTYCCCGVTSVVSCVVIFCTNYQIGLLEQMKPSSWIILLLVLAGLAGRECVKMLKQTEEYVWSL